MTFRHTHHRLGQICCRAVWDEERSSSVVDHFQIVLTAYYYIVYTLRRSIASAHLPPLLHFAYHFISGSYVKVNCRVRSSQNVVDWRLDNDNLVLLAQMRRLKESFHIICVKLKCQGRIDNVARIVDRRKTKKLV